MICSRGKKSSKEYRQVTIHNVCYIKKLKLFVKVSPESFEAAVTRSSDHDSWIGELNFDIALNIEAAFELNLSANWAKAIYWFL